MDQNCGFEVIHTKPMHQHNSGKADGSDMQNIVEGIFYDWKLMVAIHVF